MASDERSKVCSTSEAWVITKWTNVPGLTVTASGWNSKSCVAFTKTKLLEADDGSVSAGTGEAIEPAGARKSAIASPTTRPTLTRLDRLPVSCTGPGERPRP